jgi:hypothetical protein
LDNSLAPDEQVLKFTALVAGKTARRGFEKFFALTGASVHEPIRSLRRIAPITSDDERIDIVWPLREEGMRLHRDGLRRRREMADPREGPEAAKDFIEVHAGRLAEINGKLADLGEKNLYFADSTEPGYAGFCSLARWRLTDTASNRAAIERFLPASLSPDERRARGRWLKRFYSIDAC